MTQTLRYGIIGAGMMAREHVRNLKLIPGSVVSAIADPNASSREACAATVGAPVEVFDHHERLLSLGHVDALIIASPNDTHAGILRDVFQAGTALPVLVEKPVCTDISDLQVLASQAAGHKAPIWVAMEYRYMPPVAELIGAVRAGDVGTLRMLSIREHRFPFLEKVGDWNRFAKRTGGTMVEKCCHFFDLMRLVTQDEPVRVYCSGAADVNHVHETYDGRTPDIIDNSFTIVDFRGGVRAALDLCMFAEGAYFQEEIAATGDKARVEAFVPGVARFWQGGSQGGVGQGGSGPEAGKVRHAEIETSPRKPQGPTRRTVHVDEAILQAGDHHGSTYFQHLGFRASVLDGAPVVVSLEDGLRSVAIGLAAELSAREKRAVAIDGLKIG